MRVPLTLVVTATYNCFCRSPRPLVATYPHCFVVYQSLTWTYNTYMVEEVVAIVVVVVVVVVDVAAAAAAAAVIVFACNLRRNVYTL